MTTPYSMYSVVQLNGLIREAEESGETRYLTEMREERLRQLRAQVEEDGDEWEPETGRYHSWREDFHSDD